MKIFNNVFASILVFVLYSQKADAQISMTYTFDSTVLSVLFGKSEIMTVSKNTLLFDMRGKWKAWKFDSVKIDIRGFYMNNYADSVKGNEARIRYKIFGKRIAVSVAPGALELSKTVSVKRLRRHPLIKVKVKGLTDENKGTVTIDSFDFSSQTPKEE